MAKIEAKKISKLIRVGNTSLGVIIPKGFIDLNKLKKGDFVEIIVNKTGGF